MTRRLVLSYLAVTIVVLALFEIPLAVFYQQREQDRLLVDAERDATVLATIYEDALERDLDPDPVPAQEYLDETGVRSVVVDSEGISIVDTDREEDRDFSTRPEFITALSGERTSGTRHSETLNTDLLYVAVPVASGGVVHGALRLTLDTHEVDERIQRFWIGLAVIGALIMLVMAGIGTVLARSVTRPVRRLQAAADRFSLGDLTPTDFDGAALPELAALETAMNHMARRLDDLIERQRSFVADASHQLRTPLTALQLRLENLETQLDDPTSIIQLNAAVDETTRLGALVEDLLQLARTDKSPEIVIIDLAQTVRDRVDTWTATAEQDNITLNLQAPHRTVEAKAVAGGIEQALDNLIDNAIRATPNGSSVDITLEAGDQQHTVSIADHGPGIADHDKPHALTRFWRADNSTAGTGLGLAICEAIINAGGGQLALHDNKPSGLIATIEVATAADSPASEGSLTPGHLRHGH
ncbi:MAG: ATP-binding protein [Ilumatobacter sp.]|nr:ATP-binding protein [Ilumatobacter sp.]